MAQTKTEIKKGMTDVFVANVSVQALYGLTIGNTFEEEFSTVSIESILFDIVAWCAWLLQMLFDSHAQEVKDIIRAEKAHRVAWYATKAKLYQHGHTLVADEDYYDNSGLTSAQIEAAQIVKLAAAAEVPKGIRIKGATIISGDLAPLSAPELAGLKAYMERVRDAGVRIYATSGNPDSLKLHLKIYYDALVLDATGARLDGSANTPVADAVDAFLKTGVVFNGLLVLSKLTDSLQEIDGVVIPHIYNAQARYGVRPYAVIDVEYLPDAGYLRITSPADLTIDYIAHEPI